MLRWWVENEMFKFPMRRWSEPWRMLLVMLAVLLPAAALIAVNFRLLRSTQREKAIEAVYQRDYQQVLAISEKRIVEHAYEVVEEDKATLPEQPCAEDLKAFLATHPNVAHAFIWSPKGKLVWESQPARMADPDFEQARMKLSSQVGAWFEGESSDIFMKLKKMAKTEGRQTWFEYYLVPRGEKWEYQWVAVFVPRGSTSEQPELAGFIYDTDYLREKFFPQILNAVCPYQRSGNSPESQAAIMVRTAKSPTLLAASSAWDGGNAEVERKFESVFTGLVLGMKFRGTTIASISNRFLRTEFLILGTLSLLLAIGMFFTYRNVTRELALAKLKSDFVSNVSHELRTPLALIRLYAETLELGRIATPAKQHEYHEIIRKESERLSGLINNILDFSRIEAGRKEYSFRETDVADLVRSTLESYRYEIEQNGFQFEQKIDDNLPQLRVDREAIARSLLNLVNNAVKYSATEKYLRVCLYRSNGSVNLEVIDHGIGIPDGEQPKIFEKFYRVGDPLVHNTKGSGLGLSLVRHIVRAHNGEVTVESTPGKGSKFVITLPVQDGQRQEASGASA
jgi:signal transduction histidine kinase